jgi:Metallo-peptidase family M12B Reprolysin-like
VASHTHSKALRRGAKTTDRVPFFLTSALFLYQEESVKSTHWIFAAVLTLCVTGYAAGSNSIFSPATRKGDVNDPQPTVKRSRTVEVAGGELARQETVTLPLFPDVTMQLVRDELRETPRGIVWRGRVAGDPSSGAIFVIRGQVVVGNIFTRQRTFELRYTGNGVHEIREIDATKFLPEGQPADPRLPPGNPAAGPCGSNTDSGAEIDVMVVYNEASRMAAGGTESMEAEVVLAIEATNQAYINSNVTQRVNLVHTQEVSYAETGSAETDRNRLQDPSDNFINEVHALRDAYGADIVVLITDTPADACGFAFIMSTVTTTFENFAFTAVRRSCAVTFLTFPHELAHIMSARHDWANDPAADMPSPYNHGHTSVFEFERTIMSIANGTRIQFFSNPNLNYPTTGEPMGVATGMQQADNHRALNDTALTVANFRCTSPRTANVWAKDTWNDTGLEPDPATAAEVMWKSPYIWVRRAQDTLLVKQHQHENPVTGVQNFLYVKLHNGGGDTSGTLNVYFAEAAAGLSWPADWTLISGVPVASFTNHSTRIVEVPWTPGGTGHFCLLARWVSASDPMTVPETSDVNANTRNNNNIVWKNVNVVALGGNKLEETVRMRVRGVAGKGQNDVYSIVFRTPKSQPASFLTEGEVIVRLDDDLRRIWEAGGSKSSGTKPAGDALRVSENATIDNLVLSSGQSGVVEITFRRTASTPRRKYEVDVVQTAPNGAAGGVSYEVNAEIGQ